MMQIELLAQPENESKIQNKLDFIILYLYKKEWSNKEGFIFIICLQLNQKLNLQS